MGEPIQSDLTEPNFSFTSAKLSVGSTWRKIVWLFRFTRTYCEQVLLDMFIDLLYSMPRCFLLCFYSIFYSFLFNFFSQFHTFTGAPSTHYNTFTYKNYLYIPAEVKSITWSTKESHTDEKCFFFIYFVWETILIVSTADLNVPNLPSIALESS